jgi:hypothetical protein
MTLAARWLSWVLRAALRLSATLAGAGGGCGIRYMPINLRHVLAQVHKYKISQPWPSPNNFSLNVRDGQQHE